MPSLLRSSAIALAALLGPAQGLSAASPRAPYAGLSTRYDYAELADMIVAAPIAIAATIDRATALKGEAAAGVAPGNTRFYVQASVQSLIGGRAELPAKVSYLTDLPNPANRKIELKGVPVLLLAAPTGRPGELRLIGPRAQIPRTPENEQRVRAILSAAVAPDAAPAITGIGHAFHVAGSLPGEGETQIFLRTADGRPISLSVLRRPGEEPKWAVALSELVDASAAPPAPESFLWYRLACGLPGTLPESATAGLEGSDAQVAREDYATVIQGLGACKRGG